MANIAWAAYYLLWSSVSPNHRKIPKWLSAEAHRFTAIGARPMLLFHAIIGGATGRALDLRSTGQRGFKSYSGQKLRNNLGQVVHTYVPLSPSSITWNRPRGGIRDSWNISISYNRVTFLCRTINYAKTHFDRGSTRWAHNAPDR